MSARTSAGCARHRDVLIALVDRGERGPLTDHALDHLERCDRCTRELEATAEAIHALQGIGREATLAAAPDDVWPDLAARVRRQGEPAWRWQLPLASLMATAAVVALLVGPGAVWRTRPVIMQEAGISPALLSQQRAAAQRDEQSFIRNRVLTAASVRASLPTATHVELSGTPPAPDGLAPAAAWDPGEALSGMPPVPDGGRFMVATLDEPGTATSQGGLPISVNGQPSPGEDQSATTTAPILTVGTGGYPQQTSTEVRRR